MARAGLSRAAIVRAALDLLDDGGLDAVTARALAARLGVQASALYHHLPDMRALLDEIATSLMREITSSEEDVQAWEPLLRRTAARTRDVLGRHRDGARVFAGSRITDDALLPAMERPLEILTGAGLPVAEAFWTLQALLHLTVGFVIEEQHRRFDEPEQYRPEVRDARLDRAAAPLTAAATAAMAADPDEQFAYAVDLLIEGVRARITG